MWSVTAYRTILKTYLVMIYVILMRRASLPSWWPWLASWWTAERADPMIFHLNEGISMTILAGIFLSLMEEAYGDPELCVSELDSSCRADSFRGCVPEERLSSTQNVYCRFSACVLDGRMSQESCSCERCCGGCRRKLSWKVRSKTLARTMV